MGLQIFFLRRACRACSRVLPRSHLCLRAGVVSGLGTEDSRRAAGVRSGGPAPHHPCQLAWLLRWQAGPVRGGPAGRRKHSGEPKALPVACHGVHAPWLRPPRGSMGCHRLPDQLFHGGDVCWCALSLIGCRRSCTKMQLVCSSINQVL